MDLSRLQLDRRSERGASCDTSPGTGDGQRRACVFTGGVTTEDEMFVLIGSLSREWV